MKTCVKCTSPLNENDKFCPICGTEQKTNKTICNNFCPACGTALAHNSQFCPNCGNAIRNEYNHQMFQQSVPQIVRSLSERITISAVIWLVIAGIQLILGTFLVCVASLTFDWNEEYIFAILVYFVFGSLNIKEAIRLLKYQKTILSDYVGIVWENRICFGSCLNYLWNGVILFSCLTTGDVFFLFFAFLLAGAIFVDLTIIKLFVRKNKESFLQLEKSQLPNEE